MTKTHWLFVFDTFVISCISLALLIVSCATNEWLISEAYTEGAKHNSEIVYGLFTGSLTRNQFSTPQLYDLTVTCDYTEGVCFYSCHETSEIRHQELEIILKNLNEYLPCISKSKSAIILNSSLNEYDGDDEVDALNKFINEINNRNNNVTGKQNPQLHEQFIGSGYWVCTVMFLIISIIFTTLAAVLSFVNVVLNPIEPIFSIFGLYIWNGIAAGSCLLTLIIWGALYDNALTHNIAIADTLIVNSAYSSDGLANLGYSYFIVIVPLLLSLLNIVLLIIRNYLLNKEPYVPKLPEQDTSLVFY